MKFLVVLVLFMACVTTLAMPSSGVGLEHKLEPKSEQQTKQQQIETTSNDDSVQSENVGRFKRYTDIVYPYLYYPYRSSRVNNQASYEPTYEYVYKAPSYSVYRGNPFYYF